MHLHRIDPNAVSRAPNTAVASRRQRRALVGALFACVALGALGCEADHRETDRMSGPVFAGQSGALGGAGGGAAAGAPGGTAGVSGAGGAAATGAGGLGGTGGDAQRDGGAIDVPDAAPDASQNKSCGVPTRFQWVSTGPIITPKSSGATTFAAIKDPTVFFHDGQWHIYATTATTGGVYNSTVLSFADWDSADAAPQQPLQGGVAPQVFYFTPNDLWYRVSQWPDGYQTSTDPADPNSWSSKQTFYSGEPAIVTQNKGNGHWLDFWVICDSTDCFLFSSDDNGHLYRSRTSIDDFPSGFDEPVIALEETPGSRLFEAANVYSMKGTGQYLLVVEAFDSSSGGKRYFRSWTAPAIDGAWTPLQAEYPTPFASAANVTFENGSPWTGDISHGEMLRSSSDEKLEIDTCDLRFLYQGLPPGSGGDYNSLPWRLGLLTMTP